MIARRLAWILAALGVAQSVAAADLHVLSAHAPATAAGVLSGAAYLSVHNVGATSDRLLRASTPVAAQVEFHRSQFDGSVLRMRPLPGIDIPVGGSIEMSPSGLHLMLLGLKHPLRPGEQFPLRLEFARAGVVDALVKVISGT